MNDETIGEDMEVAMSEHKDAGVSTVEAQKHLAGALLEMRRNVAHLKGVVDVLKSRCGNLDESLKCLESRKGEEHLPIDSAAQKAIQDHVNRKDFKSLDAAREVMMELIWVREEAHEDTGNLGINAVYAEHQQIGAFRLASVMLNSLCAGISTDDNSMPVVTISSRESIDYGGTAGEFVLHYSKKTPLDDWFRWELSTLIWPCEGNEKASKEMRKQLISVRNMIDTVLADEAWPKNGREPDFDT